MGFFNRFFNKKENNGYQLKLVTETGNGFYNFNGVLYESDIIRSCIRPKAKAIGKLTAQHIKRGPKNSIKINPEMYMKFLLEEPNPYMTGQIFQEKMTTQLELNNNAFALVVRDENGFPMQLYPIPAYGVQAKYKPDGELYLRFNLKNGKLLDYDYTDLIHLRQDFNNNDLFGDNPSAAIVPLMNIITTMDQGLIKAIQNSNVIKWIMKFRNMLRPEDQKLHIKEFVDNYLSIDADSGGAVASDTKYDLEQVKSESYVANGLQMKETMMRIYNFYNTNEKIVQSKWTEDDWNSYYESQVEPLAKQMSGEYTRKLFTRKERGQGNVVMFDSSSLAHASMSTKLGLVALLDRGILNANEIRNILNLAPTKSGDEYVRRLDTALVGEGGETIDKD